jgi:hypothetical protein
VPEKVNTDRDGKERMNDRIEGKKSEDPGMMLPHDSTLLIAKIFKFCKVRRTCPQKWHLQQPPLQLNPIGLGLDMVRDRVVMNINCVNGVPHLKWGAKVLINNDLDLSSKRQAHALAFPDAGCMRNMGRFCLLNVMVLISKLESRRDSMIPFQTLVMSCTMFMWPTYTSVSAVPMGGLWAETKITLTMHLT